MDNYAMSCKEREVSNVLGQYLKELRNELQLRSNNAFRLALYKLSYIMSIFIFSTFLSKNRILSLYLMTFCIAIIFDILIANKYRLINITKFFIEKHTYISFQKPHNLLIEERYKHTLNSLLKLIMEIGICYLPIIYAFLKFPANLHPNTLGIRMLIISALILSSMRLIRIKNKDMAKSS